MKRYQAMGLGIGIVCCAYANVAHATNTNLASYSAIVAGNNNEIFQYCDYSFIGSGYGNLAGSGAGSSYTAPYSFIGGGYFNAIYQDNLSSVEQGNSIVGGEYNTTLGVRFATIGGGAGNAIFIGLSPATGGDYAFIGGGYYNSVNDEYGAVSGGFENLAGYAASVGGGQKNSAGLWGAVGGGYFNTASGALSFVGGGSQNVASAYAASVLGGQYNTASGDSAAAFGIDSVASGSFSFAGGYECTAGGTSSVALGDNAAVSKNNCFVFADHNTSSVQQDCGVPTTTNSTGALTATNDAFVVRAFNGVNFITGYDASQHPNAGAYLTAGGNQWNYYSDRNVKHDFQDVDTHDVLLRVAAMPITTWVYNSEPSAVRHMGPMAQDFYANFALGEDERHIASLDEPAVALAAIQGLYGEVLQRDETIHTLTARTTSLEKANASLEKDRADARRHVASLEMRLEAIEARLGLRQ